MQLKMLFQPAKTADFRAPSTLSLSMLHPALELNNKYVMIRQQRLQHSALSLCRRHINHSNVRQALLDGNRILSFLLLQHGRSYSSTSGPVEQHDDIRHLKIGIKANIVTSSASPCVDESIASSASLKGFTSPFDSTVVRKLRECGGVVEDLLRTYQRMDEFGMGSHSQNLRSPVVDGPFTRDGVPLSPGGSSGGSAVAVALGQCDVALGTDTGGSVRLPAAYCGIVGFKPSYGRISRWGVVQYANSLDTVGMLGRRVWDVERVFAVVDGEDWRDGTCLGGKVRRRMGREGNGVEKKLRIGVPVEYHLAEVSREVRETWKGTLTLLRDAGHSLHVVSLPSTRSALSAYYILAPAEASSNLAKYDGIRYGHRTESGADARPNVDPPLPLYAQTRNEGFGEEVKRRILLGAYTLSSAAMDNYFIQAQKIRRLVQRDFDKVFARLNPLLDNAGSDEGGEVDVLFTPTAPTLPPTVDEVKKQTSLESYMNDVFTVPASLAGLPAISIPAPVQGGGREGGVGTVGMQLVGQFGDDGLVLRAAAELENLLKNCEV